MAKQSETADIVQASEYLELKSKVAKTGIKMIIGFIIGIFLGVLTTRDSEGFSAFMTCAFWGFVCSGVPAAYTWIPFVALSPMTWCIKIAIALFGGMILSPFLLIYEIIQIVRLNHMKKAL